MCNDEPVHPVHNRHADPRLSRSKDTQSTQDNFPRHDPRQLTVRLRPQPPGRCRCGMQRTDVIRPRISAGRTASAARAWTSRLSQGVSLRDAQTQASVASTYLGSYLLMHDTVQRCIDLPAV